MEISKRKYFLFSIFLSLLIAFLVEHRVFVDDTAINDDVRNQIYWMARLADPTLFPNDLIADYFAQPSLISPIVKIIYEICSIGFTPKDATQILPFVLVVISTFFLFEFVSVTSGHKYAFWVCYGFNLTIWMMNDLAGGLPRAFFYPLFFYFLFIVAKKAWIWLPLCFVLQTMIYPIDFFLSIIILVIEIVWNLLSKIKPSQEKISAIFVSIFCGLSILYLRYIYFQPKTFGPLIKPTEAFEMPEFFSDGRVDVFLVPYKFIKEGFSPDLFFSSQEKFINFLVSFFAITLLLIASYWFYQKYLSKTGPLIIPELIISSGIASVLISVLAVFNLFYLYLPQRYLGYIFPLIFIFVISAYLYHVELAFPKLFWLLVLAAFLVLFIFQDDDLIHLDENQYAICQFLKNTPKDSLIAASSSISSDIPAFAYRSILVSYEANIPFHKGYYKQIKERNYDLNKAYYSTDSQVIIDFIKKHNINYLVINKNDFKKSKILNGLPDSCDSFNSGPYSVVSSQKILAGCLNTVR